MIDGRQGKGGALLKQKVQDLHCRVTMHDFGIRLFFEKERHLEMRRGDEERSTGIDPNDKNGVRHRGLPRTDDSLPRNQRKLCAGAPSSWLFRVSECRDQGHVL